MRKSTDDKPLFILRKDFSGGVNTRHHASKIAENQVSVLYNTDIGTVGEATKRPGSVLIGDDLGANDIEALHNYEIQGATDQLLSYEGTTLRKWTGSGNWSAALKSDFSASQTDIGIISAKESGLSPDDIVIVQNGTDNAFRFDSAGNAQDLGSTAGTGSDSPPKSTVMAWYANRIWVLKNDLLYFSAAYSADYSSAFDTVTDIFRIPVGTERKILPTRDFGMIICGEQAIWSLFPSATPAATDRPEPILADMGVVSKKGAVVAGDDIYFFSHDGFRALKRTVQDKLQTGASYPISYLLKDEFARVSWSNISQLSMVYFDNKIFISVPTDASSYDTWVYYPALNAFMIIQGWSPKCWATYKVSGEERLYYGKDGDGTVYRAWNGYTDEGTTTTNGTAITQQIEGREEDFGQPLLKKNGGEVEIEAKATEESQTLTIDAALDQADYQNLGTITLTGSFYTKLLLHGDGTDGSTTITDETGKTVTANGNVQLDTAQKKFDTASILFDGTGDYISIPDSNDWNFGSGDFTIDFWIRFNSVAGTDPIYVQAVDSNNYLYLYWAHTNPWLFLEEKIGGTSKSAYCNPGAASTGTWYHIAVVRVSGITKFFIDGVQKTTSSDTLPSSLTNIAGPVWIGVDYNGAAGDALDGWIDEFRVSKGIARWTADFTPETSAYSYNSYVDKLIKRKKFHLDNLGSFRNIKLKILNSASNTEDVTAYGYQIVAYPEEYENE